MEAFVGSWKLIQNEDYDKFLRATGADEEVISVSNVVRPVVTISKDDDVVVVKLQSAIGAEGFSFRLGKQFYHQKKDGRYCNVVVDLEENQLIQVEKWDGNEATSIAEVKDGKLFKTIKFKDVTAVQTYMKI
ncbi:fatty acid-binding protein, brain [Ictalurus punctatus]|uniref:Fatty acid-binding protein, brain n=1 Tax=Ictalurus punctatus TaxID=7998 RepID=A0A2D0PYK8_ICTPU|nr:fatty acid-binding protein, brain [Ictalurus punctatus]